MRSEGDDRVTRNAVDMLEQRGREAKQRFEYCRALDGVSQWCALVDGPRSSNPSCQVNILRHHCDSLRMDGRQIRVFKQTNQTCFHGFLQRHQGRALITKRHAPRECIDR
jgi:hypothetical protein